jgi:hypothetical protein
LPDSMAEKSIAVRFDHPENLQTTKRQRLHP